MALCVKRFPVCNPGTLRVPTDSAITRTGLKPEPAILNTASIPVPAYQNQDERFSSAFAILKQAIAQRAFPSASIAVTQAGQLLALKSFGNFVYKDDLEGARFKHLAGILTLKVLPETLFDLASLTKPIATTTMAMLLYERGLLELDSPGHRHSPRTYLKTRSPPQ